ncbi:hypothetical protein [Thiolapillus sp.]|uniref:hypothetical protein n=2 Tax=Thiolapillus sp. TaxID=2017437 RepID=UPI0025D609B7|nr:hypothetical protein [Thiolapillus sp.]
MTRTAGEQIGCQRPSRFWGLGCPKIYHEAEDTLEHQPLDAAQGEVCLKCLVLQQGSSALPAPLLSLYQPVVWLILSLASDSGRLYEMQLIGPVARGPPSETV